METLILWLEEANQIKQNKLDKNVCSQVNYVKDELNKKKINVFDWTPKHLEELLKNWYILWTTINTSFKQWSTKEYQDNSFLELRWNNIRVRVYFDLEIDENWENKNIYILAWEKKQLIFKDIHNLIFNHFNEIIAKKKTTN